MELEPFEAWLSHEGYARTTVTSIVRAVHAQATHGPVPQFTDDDRRLRTYRWAWAAFEDWCEETGRVNPLPEPPEPETRGRRKRQVKKRRTQVAVSVAADEWGRLTERVRADESIEGRVIDVLCVTALRISDVLRIRKDALDQGFARPDGLTTIAVKGDKPIMVSVRGGAGVEWARLHQAVSHLRSSQLVCEAVSKSKDWTASGGAAYQAVRRRLRVLGDAAGVQGRVHLHRLRRTVAVHAALEGVPAPLIQQMLGHESLETTGSYLDESMAIQVAAMQGKLRR